MHVVSSIRKGNTLFKNKGEQKQIMDMLPLMLIQWGKGGNMIEAFFKIILPTVVLWDAIGFNLEVCLECC